MTVRRFVAGLLVILCLVNGMGIHAQSTDPAVTAALKVAKQTLSQKLGKPINTLENFSYSLETYPDTGLGCPDPTQSYTTASIQIVARERTGCFG